MLKNNEERAKYLRTHAHIILDAGYLIIKTVAINERLYYNKLYIKTSTVFPEPCEEFVCVHRYCSDSDSYRIGYSHKYKNLPDSDSQAVAYLKEHRNDEFVKELTL